MPEKIIWDIETWRGRYPRLVWPFWTQQRKWFFVPEYGLEDIEGQPSPLRSKIRRSKFKLIYTKKKTQDRINLEEVWKHTIMKLGGIVDE